MIITNHSMLTGFEDSSLTKGQTKYLFWKANPKSSLSSM